MICHKYNINGHLYAVSVRPGLNYVIVHGRRGFHSKCEILTDESGKKYFNYKSLNTYIDNWCRLNYKTFMSLFDKDCDTYVFNDDLLRMLLTEGIDNVIFTIPMEIGNVQVEKRCVIDDRRYKVTDNYKLQLNVCNDDYDGGIKSTIYYVGDLMNHIRAGDIKISLKNK